MKTSILSLLLILTLALSAFAAQTDISGPAASNFGENVTVLPNGNIVVTAPQYDIPAGASNVGAVYLYDGATLNLISTLVGSTANDQVGNTGVTVLTNGNFVVSSQNWNGNRGAATFCSAVTGCNFTVSSANSLVGSAAGDSVGSGVTALTNGNYVVSSVNWDNGAITNVGAVTFGSGTSGTSGAVSATNSLVGSTVNDLVGSNGVTALTNGNYVVRSSSWDNGAITNVGAVTFGSGTSGTSGAVSATNSLVGSMASDSVGITGVTALTNGNYVVSSANWDNGTIANAGAATFGSGTSGISGAVSATNSLVGSMANDAVGITGVTALTNGNYVVISQSWDNGAITNVGAVTFGNGVSGTNGAVSTTNSLVGSAAGDAVGNNGVVAMTNGNYVVRSSGWDNGAITNVGAVTFGSGVSGISGAVSATNSLVGSATGELVGNGGVTALTNGNYVIRSPNWKNGAITDAGAVTFGNGVSGTSGAVSATNSLVGSAAGDVVGSSGVVALTNGNYVVRSSSWDNGAITNVGAVTFGSGTSGTSGAVSATNSLVGSTASDLVGSSGVVALTNGNYVVNSANWDNGAITDVGAVTFGNGVSGISGAVSATNSLVGSATSDNVGNSGVVALTNGNYVVNSQSWDNGAITDAGAVTFGSGTSGTSGAVSATNSLVGSTASDLVGNGGVFPSTNGNYVVRSQSWDNGAIINTGAFTFGNGASGTSGAITSGTSGGNSVVGTVTGGTSSFAFDATRNRLFVGRAASNTVSILSFTTTATVNGNINNAANWSNGVPNALLTGIIPSGRSMSISSVMNIGQLRVQCGGNLTGGSASAYIVGSVRRDFCGAVNESFIYPIGGGGSYSPLNVSNANGTGALTAAVTDNFMPLLTGVSSAKSLSRYWSLEGAGITTDLTFNYADADVNGMEADYKVFKRSAATNTTVQVTSSVVNAAANTITATGVSQFSDWSAGESPLGPTAAAVSISGRVITPQDLGLTNAIVTLTDSNGVSRTVLTGKFGNFIFRDVEAGETYILTVSSKRYTYAAQIVSPTENLSGITFSAQ